MRRYLLSLALTACALAAVLLGISGGGAALASVADSSGSSSSGSSTTSSTSTTACSGSTTTTSSSSSTTSSSTSSTATLPTLTLTLTGKSVAVGGDMVSGAVDVMSTNSSKSCRQPVLFHLNQGVSQQQFGQAMASVEAHHGNLNYLDQYGQLVFNALAPPGTSSAQTVLAPGDYDALDTAGTGKPPTQAFSIAQSSSPAALPAAAATITTIDFGFRGPKILRDGEVVRAENDGFLVHMDAFARVRSLRVAAQAVKLMQAGRTNKAARLFSGEQGAFAGPLSTGSMQQAVLDLEPGFYVQFSVMMIQSGRRDIRLGMERIFRVLAAATKPPANPKH